MHMDERVGSKPGMAGYLSRIILRLQFLVLLSLNSINEFVLCVCDMNRERRAMQSEICQSASGQRENFPSPYSHDS